MVAEPADGRGRAVGAGEGIRVDVEGAAVGRLRTGAGGGRGVAAADGPAAGGGGRALRSETTATASEGAARATPGLNGLFASRRTATSATRRAAWSHRLSGPEDDLDGVRRVPVDGRPDGLPVVLEPELVRHDHGMRQETGGEHVERPVDGVPVRRARQPRRRVRIDGVVDGADQRRLLVPDRREVDLADPGRAEEEHAAPVGDGAERLGDGSRRSHRLDDVGEPAHQHLVALAADDACAAQGRQFLPVPVVGIAEYTTWSAPQAVAASRLVRVAGQDGDRAVREAARVARRGRPSR